MPITCPHCTRPNPPQARFCHHDGRPLSLQDGAPPADPARQGFVHPFVFPSGRTCFSFDELVLGCVEEWQTAGELLREGVLGSFLANLGRPDLARAAAQANRTDKDDLALDEFLRALPGRTYTPPTLGVEPARLNLGRLAPGTDQVIPLGLANLGMGILQGAVTSDADWLSPAASGNCRIFQFLHDSTVSLVVHGKLLRASSRPLEARLTIESNGGCAVVVVQAEVVLHPFPQGILAGARNPRELAEKARCNPREAAPLFAGGAVARWYAANGWEYPVPGPGAPGVAGVQQFFEAIGLTRPPRVEISESAVTLAGQPGQLLLHPLSLTTTEKKLVFAHASSDQPWLRTEVSLNNRDATVQLIVESVPECPGEQLTANLTVRANGRQRWTVPVSLEVHPESPAAPLADPDEGVVVVARPTASPEEPAGSQRLESRGPQAVVSCAVLGGVLGGLAFWLLRAGYERATGTPAVALGGSEALAMSFLGAWVGMLVALAPSTRRTAWVQVEAGFAAGRQLVLTRPRTSLGRVEDCPLSLFGDPGIEKVHACIVRQGDHFSLLDAGTSGGTFLNGRRVTAPTRLRPGDLIALGKARLRFGQG